MSQPYLISRPFNVLLSITNVSVQVLLYIPVIECLDLMSRSYLTNVSVFKSYQQSMFHFMSQYSSLTSSQCLASITNVSGIQLMSHPANSLSYSITIMIIAFQINFSSQINFLSAQVFLKPPLNSSLLFISILPFPSPWPLLDP